MIKVEDKHRTGLFIIGAVAALAVGVIVGQGLALHHVVAAGSKK